MALQFGGTPIGGMQYGGVTIGEAMIDGQVVYRSFVSIYPVTGTWSGNLEFGLDTLVHTHTVAEPGNFTITHTLTGRGGVWGLATVRTKNGDSYSSSDNTSVGTTTENLSPGDTIEFLAQNTDWGTETYDSHWLIVKN